MIVGCPFIEDSCTDRYGQLLTSSANGQHACQCDVMYALVL